MSKHLAITAESRTDLGRSASRCLRRAEKVPGVIYGANKEAQSITVKHDDILHALENEAFYSSIIAVTIDGKIQKAVLKDLQRHAYKPKITHVDFLRVDENVEIHVHVPLHFIGECPAVKQGGVINHLVNEVEVVCLPKDLPEFISIDLSALGLDQTIHISELTAPAGVKFAALIHDNDMGVVNVHIPRAIKADEDDTAAPEASEVPATKVAANAADKKE